MAYLRNCWYVAALSKEVQASKIFTRKILDENILFFRDQTGLATAMADRCPHRFAQLSMGKLQDDCIQCPYHGLTFNQQGQCVHNPHGDGRIPDKAKVKVFPVVERYSAIWIWMGEPALANPKTIPSCDFLDSENFYIGSDYMNIQGNYLLESDNILDLSHIEFVHPLFSSPSVSAGEYKCEVEGNTIWSKRDIYNDSQAPEFIHKVFRIPQGTVIDRWLHVHWQAPAIMALYSGGVASGKNRSEGVETPGFHWFTPETETSSHYFFGISTRTNNIT